jgi:hypothetical protein
MIIYNDRFYTSTLTGGRRRRIIPNTYLNKQISKILIMDIKEYKLEVCRIEGNDVNN